jgi:hypothetical protein
MAFSLSVHNAGAGLLSIATGSKAASRAIAAGRNTFVATLIDALTLLLEHQKVLLLMGDETVPEDYHPYLDEAPAVYAFAILLNQGDDFRVDSVAARSTESSTIATLPQGLEFLAWLHSDKGSPFSCFAMSNRWRVTHRPV